MIVTCDDEGMKGARAALTLTRTERARRRKTRPPVLRLETEKIKILHFDFVKQ